MKNLTSAFLLVLGLFVSAHAMATSTVGLGKTAKQAVRAELKIAHPGVKFGAIQLSPSGIAKRSNWTAIAKLNPKLHAMPIEATGSVFDGVGGWRATIK